MATIYLDNNATTRVAPEVAEAMLPWFTERFGNPSSKHHFGDTAAKAVKQARRQVQALLGAAHRSELVFTSGGTESNVTALRSALSVQPERREIITTAVEHPAVLETCQILAQTGYTVHILQVDGAGRLDLTEYQRLLSRRVALVSVMWANNETGTLFPVEAMAEMAHDAGVMFHTDAVQAAAKLPIELGRSRIDMLSLSGHKLHAPKGIGVLYLRRGLPFRPLLLGGHQERGRRAGTENTPAIVALGKAAELAMGRMDDEMSTVGILRDRLEHGILAAVAGAFTTGDGDNRLPNTANIAFELDGNEHIPLLLDRFGVAASSGSACSSGAQEPSHVMRAMGIPDTAARGAVRFSLSRYNTAEEIDQVIDAMIAIVEKLRRLSPPTNPLSTPHIPLRPSTAQVRGLEL
jgi:cysteine desulfurase